MRRDIRALLVLLFVGWIGRGIGAGTPGSALPPPSTGGLALLDPLLQKLTTNRRLLIIGAHPDDENTALLALVSRKLGGEAGYLSLSRGEGGQNLIGEELGVGLGLIRSQELNAARRLDGARQFFTRAYDFGFTRSLEETLRLWPKEILLEDAVRIVRRFRPQVLYSIFTGTDRDGHGQHQASALIAREVFRAAGDPAAFPALRREGLAPWKPTSLFRSDWFEAENSIVLPTGDVEPISGRSYHQIAMASRSLHRSQDMGRLQEPGPNQTGGIWVEGGPGPGARDLFDGIDTRLRSIVAGVADPPRRARLEGLLDGVEARARQVRLRLSPATLPDAVPALGRIVEDLRSARAEVTEANGGVAALLEEKSSAAEAALAAAAGVTLDALSEVETAAPGDLLAVTVGVWNAGPAPVEVESVSLESPDGWETAPLEPAGGRVASGTLSEWKGAARVLPGNPPTVPYFLERPLTGSTYDWTDVPPAVAGEPFDPPPLRAEAVVRIGAVRTRLTREVTFRIRNEALGEIRRPVRAVPRLDVAVEPDLIVWPTEPATPRSVEATLVSNSSGPIEGVLRLEMPAGWPAAREAGFSLSKKGDRRLVRIALPRRTSPPAGRFTVGITAVLSDGERFSTSIHVLDYDHIRPTPFPRRSQVAVMTLDLRLPRLTRVGYVRGASDRVPEALEAVGVPVHLLTPAELEHGDLSRFDAIVVGSRAYETNPALAASNGRLLDYAREGGLLIVQYQQYPFVQGNFAPAKLEIARPHDRITDESAPVELLEPGHPIFTTPNRIGASDWEHWVQERGLYFARSWDPAYRPLLSMSDPGGTPQKGGLLVADVGNGRYVWTGLAFFRQLPAGVPGAYRLFANLLAWRPARPQRRSST